MKVSKWLYTVLVLLLLWLFLTGSTSWEEVIAGIVVSVLIALFASDIFTE
ncbi:MAG: Na+/H+ antiporter subunit E, partial [Candidatus Hydrothermae bacterium]|nr:Na+/H+ antiporter subunit E [Candidatus Hydrothermae bacterium]